MPAPADIDVEAVWYLVATNPQKERRAQLGLEFRGYKTFLPSYAKEVKSGRQIKEVTRPLFPGYLLVNLAGQPWYPIRQVDGVHRIITNDLKPLALPEGAMKEIVRLSHEEQDLAPQPWAQQLQEGAQARVAKGPFASFLSTVVAVLPNGRAQVLVDIFGRATEVELELLYLEAV
nr:transcription termination/antitermination NusG family protein [Microvirga zambiensis]